MIYTLENNKLRIAVATKGAELKSIYDKVTEKELIWQADSIFWGKSSPVLFPIVGALKDDLYYYNDKKYNLSRHGFARDNVFEIEKLNTMQIRCTLASTENTKLVYPFDFRLTIVYTLVEDKLEVNYKVANLSSTDKMFFSLGAHPAFNVGKKEEEFSDYQLKFDKEESLIINSLKNNLLAEEKSNLVLDDKILRLNYALFENDALVILDLKSDKIELLHNTQGKLFDFEFKNLPYFGIWTVQNANFICLEPWAGIADFESHNQKLEDKVGIIMLEPNKNWVASWSIKTNN